MWESYLTACRKCKGLAEWLLWLTGDSLIVCWEGNWLSCLSWLEDWLSVERKLAICLEGCLAELDSLSVWGWLAGCQKGISYLARVGWLAVEKGISWLSTLRKSNG